jgi:hypothetical protein
VLNDIRENILIRFALETWEITGDDPLEFIEVNSIKAEKDKRKQNYYLRSDDNE